MVGRLRQQLARGRTHDQPRAGGVAGVDMDLVHALPGAVAVKFDIADVLPRRQLELCQIRGQRSHGHCLGMVLAAVLDGAATGGIHQQALLVALGIQQFDFIAQFVKRAALARNVQHPATVARRHLAQDGRQRLVLPAGHPGAHGLLLLRRAMGQASGQRQQHQPS